MTGELDWKAEQEQWESDHPSMIRADLETRLRQLTTAAVFPATMATTRDYVYRPCLADDACPDLADNDVASPGALCHRHAARDGTGCHYCKADPPDVATVEHVVPCSKGGPNWDDNLVIACQRCNWKRSDRNEPHPGCDFCAAARAKYPAAA